MARRNFSGLMLMLICLIFVFPPIVAAQSNDLQEGDACRRILLKDKKGRKSRGRWKQCISLYKQTKDFEEREGRAAYEVARLYHLRAFSSKETNAEDLKKAQRYYKNAIKQNKMRAGLIADAKKLLRAVELELVVLSEAASKTGPIDSDAAPPLNFVLTPKFSVGGKLGLEVRTRENRDFNRARDDNDTRIEAELTLAMLYQFGEGKELFGEVKFEDEENYEPERKGGHSGTLKGKLSTAYLMIHRFMMPSMDLELGRQRFKDSREWIYDEKLDGARIFYRFSMFESQLSVSTNLLDPKKPIDKIINLVSYNIYRFGSGNKASLYVVNRKRQALDLQLTFTGVSLKGRPGKNLKYWLELGSVSGSDGPTDVSGYGFDIGASVRLKQPLRPYITLGYAFGSGDKSPGDNKDKNFRQTGLQDNAAKLWGVTRIKYYGELFDPELSNMMIGSIGVGFRPMKKASFDMIYYHYTQVWTMSNQVNTLRDVGIRAPATGNSRNLGNELDLVFGMKMSKRVKFEIISAIFSPGRAFANSDSALQIEAELEITF